MGNLQNITPKREPKTLIKPGTDLFNGIVEALSGLSTLRVNEVTGEPAKAVGTLKLNVLSMDKSVNPVTVDSLLY